MEKIKIVYIDDAPDTELSCYLDNYSLENYEFESKDIEFKPSEGYESLIINSDVISANIVFIDSRLFENRNADRIRFIGEEFKIILKKHFPFIEVIVITQNEISEGYETIAKYSPNNEENAKEYYDKIIPRKIKAAVKNIRESRKIMEVIKNNDLWEDILVEKLSNSLNGCGTYDELKKEDIDNIVKIFTEIQRDINE